MIKMKPTKSKESKPCPPVDCPNPSVQQIPGDPATAWELVNKYGTYEIQPTSDADHKYPAIHQGLPTQWKNLRESKEALFPDYVQKNQ